MKKNIFYITILAAILLSACNRDDLYEDPSRPGQGTPQTMLTSIEVNTFMNYEGEFSRLASVYSQHMAGVSAQYTDFQNYIVAETAFSNSWEALYTNCMYNAVLLDRLYGEKNPYYSGMSKVLLAMNLGIATDMWGDVPYSDAFKATDGQFISKYDTQEQVLNSIQTLLSEALTSFDKSESDNLVVPASDDLIFKGDIASWKRVTWILKARYANRLSLKDANASATNVVSYIDNALAITLDKKGKENMEAVHDGEMYNQWLAFEEDRGGVIKANKYFVDILLTRNDPRLGYFFSKNAKGNYVGADISVASIATDGSAINTDEGSGYFSVDMQFPLVTLAEAYFLRAEAKARLGQDASDDLNDAIKASVSYVTKGAQDGVSLATYDNTTADETSILTEKWIALFSQLEPYNDYRRTGIPALTPRPQSAGAAVAFTPRSLTTPLVERLYNKENVVLHGVDTPVWWAVP